MNPLYKAKTDLMLEKQATAIPLELVLQNSQDMTQKTLIIRSGAP